MTITMAVVIGMKFTGRKNRPALFRGIEETRKRQTKGANIVNVLVGDVMKGRFSWYEELIVFVMAASMVVIFCAMRMVVVAVTIMVMSVVLSESREREI
jgi:hypothetical protein